LDTGLILKHLQVASLRHLQTAPRDVYLYRQKWQFRAFPGSARPSL